MWFIYPSYLQLMWFQFRLVCSLKRLCLQFPTLSSRLRKIFPPTHPQFDSVFEDVGAAGYYLREAGYRLESVLLTVQGDSAGSASDGESGDNEIE
jgi:hypothetical protein